MTEPSPAVRTQPGRVGKALIRLLMKHATIVQSETLGKGFRLLTLEGPAFRGVAWLPGQKVQIPIGSAFVTRTYTPINWDATAGRMDIIGYAHGAGPGSEWVREVGQGHECDIFGPRASLDLTRLSGPLALFGDETSFGLAVASANDPRIDLAQCLFEVNDIGIARPVVERVGLAGALLVERQDGDAHLPDLEHRLAGIAATGASFVLTGKAPSIQRLRQSLKTLGVPPTRIMTKAYWAPGKFGLD